MKIRKDRGQGHIIHGGFGVFWRRRGKLEPETKDLTSNVPVATVYAYLPWLRLRIDLTPRRRSK
tara:strand:+ start:4142 stop:4333 length:192 start_codon:yes stop_codon:yes gene_type:complete